ncbi:signal recognition particle-docking protein FtsY [Pseudoalteromonas sp. SCSIO 43210]
MAKKSKFLSWFGFGKSDEKQAEQVKETNNQQALAEQQEAERIEQERAETEKHDAEQAEKLAVEQANAELLAKEQADAHAKQLELQQRLAEQEMQMRLEQERIAAEKAEAERLEQARIEAEKVETERLEQARIEAEKVETERLEQARVAAEQAESDRLEQARIEAEKVETERLEQARIEAEKVEIERLEQARVEAEKAESDRLEQARIEAEKVETERLEQARIEAEKAETERLEQARIEAEKAESDRLEQARIEAEKAENERLEQARVAAEQAESERLELARVAAEKTENERLELARVAAEQAESDRLEQARVAAEKVESERLEQASIEAEKLKAEKEDKPKKEGFFSRLKKGLLKTRVNIGSGFASIFSGKKIDDDLFEELETQLLTADLGVDTTMKLIDRLTDGANRKQLKDGDALYELMKQEMATMLKTAEQPLVIPTDKKPFVILMVGVNGVGKTTTIGKLAKQFQNEGKSVMLAAGDTFRAAAVEQLQVWGERNSIPVIAQHTGADSASVVFDAFQAAKARKVDVLIADTAGRLQNKDNLMQELEKIARVMKKIDPDAPHEVMLTIDAGTGQNAISQVNLFNQCVGLTGITLSKLDGTAKGGVIFAVADKFNIPIRYIGVGESIDDLRTFKSDDFIDALFSQDEDDV